MVKFSSSGFKMNAGNGMGSVFTNYSNRSFVASKQEDPIKNKFLLCQFNPDSVLLGDASRVNEWKSIKNNFSLKSFGWDRPYYKFNEKLKTNVLSFLPKTDEDKKFGFCLQGEIETSSPRFSVCCLVKFNRITQPFMKFDYLFNWGSESSKNNVSIARWHSDNTSCANACFVSDGKSAYRTEKPIIAGEWFVLTTVHDFVNKEHNVYHDFEHVPSLERCYNDNISLKKITIGKYPFMEFPNHFPFEGEIAELLIFEKALLKKEIIKISSFLKQKYYLECK